MSELEEWENFTKPSPRDSSIEKDHLPTNQGSKNLGIEELTSLLREETIARQKTEHELREVKNTLEAFFETAPVLMGIVEVTSETIIVLTSNRATRNFFNNEYIQKTGTAKEIIDYWHPFYGVCEREKRPVTFEYSYEGEAGTRYLSVCIFLIGRSPNGNARFSYVGNDVTDQRKISNALDESNRRLELALEFGKTGMWQWSLKSGELMSSHTSANWYGVSSADGVCNIKHDDFISLVNEEDRDPLVANWRRSIEEKKEHFAEFRIRSAKGETVWLQRRGHPVLDESGNVSHILGVICDISERKKFEAEKTEQDIKLLMLSKMSALGEMASSIAHEINNPLSIIRTKAELLSNRLSNGLNNAELPKEVIQKFSRDISETTHRISQIIDGLKFFARDGESDDFQETDVFSIIEDTLAFCHERFQKAGVELRINSIPTFELFLDCRPVQISQVFLNLLNNAFYATKKSPTESKWVEIAVRDEKDFLVITISDNGIGVPKDLQTKIFNPFFSTKPVGDGTGMGLSISKGIIESHRGSISVTSENLITRFHVKIPKHHTKKDPLHEEY